MARRVSKSGAWMSAGRPHSNRETSRDSIFWISLARRSLERTICLPGLEEVVEGVEELLLDPLLAGEELHVVDQEDIDMPVALAEFGQAVLLQRLDELVGEFLGGQVGDAGIGLLRRMACPIACIRWVLPEPGLAVDEQGVVGLRGGLGHGQRRGVGHLVVGSDDKCVERVPGDEGAGAGAAIVVAAGAARGGRAHARGGWGGFGGCAHGMPGRSPARRVKLP